MDLPPELESEFHEWYDTEHIPMRLRLPGFGAAVRYESVGSGTRFLVCYFIDDLAVLETADYARVKQEPSERTERMLSSVRGFTRYTCELVDDTGPATPTRFTTVHALRTTHGAAEMEAGYTAAMHEFGRGRWSRSRLFRPFGASVGEPWTHLALHEIAASGESDDTPAELPTGLWPDRVEADVWLSYRAFRRFGDLTS